VVCRLQVWSHYREHRLKKGARNRRMAHLSSRSLFVESVDPYYAVGVTRQQTILESTIFLNTRLCNRRQALYVQYLNFAMIDSQNALARERTENSAHGLELHG